MADLLTVGGMVRSTPDNVGALMRERQTILVFPCRVFVAAGFVYYVVPRIVGLGQR